MFRIKGVTKLVLLWSLPLWLASSASIQAESSKCSRLATEASRQGLDQRVEKGDPEAARCLALALRSLDGGELEDALVALGQFGDHRPADLLSMARQGTLSKRSLVDAVAMLPLSLSDNLPAQAAALKGRHDKYSKVVRASLTTEQELVLRSIDTALRDLRP